MSSPDGWCHVVGEAGRAEQSPAAWFAAGGTVGALTSSFSVTSDPVRNPCQKYHPRPGSEK